MTLQQVVVTGASGFIGRRAVALLDTPTRRVIGVSRATGYDLRQTEWWRSVGGLPTAVDAVLHLAGHTFVPDSWTQPSQFYENVTMTANVLEFCRRTGARMIFVSAYIYGAPQYLPIDESHPVAPANPYAHSKYLSEQVCEFYARHLGLNVVVLRPFNVYGPGQDARFLIPTIATQLQHGTTVTVRDLEPRRDYLYVDDLVNAAARFIDAPARDYAVYNAGSGGSVSVRELIQRMSRVLGRDVEIRDLVERRRNEIQDCVSDNGRLRAVSGWAPAWDLERGLAAVVRPGAGEGVTS